MNSKESEIVVASQTTAQADSYKLRISFSGLCALVPRGDSFQTPKRMDVILVADDDNDQYSDVHRPVVGIYVKNLLGGDANGKLKDTMAFLELDREDVEFFLVERSSKTAYKIESDIKYLDGRKAGDKPFRDLAIPTLPERELDFKAQQLDFSWLPRMKMVLSSASYIDPGHVTRQAPENVVKARVLVSGGDFGSHSLGSHKGGFVVTQFTPAIVSGSPVRQAIAHWAGSETVVSSKYDVLIRISKMGSPQNKREVVLRPKDNESLVIQISNLCCGYYGSEEVEGLKGLRSLQPDDDFDRFYYLLPDDQLKKIKNTFGQLPLPIPVDYPAVQINETGGVDPIRCSGVVFEAVPL